MSTIQINIPDCAISDSNSSNHSVDNITIDTSSCPAQPAGPPAFITIGPTVIIAVAVVALAVATAVVRYRAHEVKPDKLKAFNDSRKIELDAEIRMAALRKHCPTCGDVYEPTLEDQSS